eukprot:TRINITY_DN4717_c0_g2_i4.p6 TRINITY_DN4717_c0_g2~~TRINITY_DN4717_c0_g2_i4.p6  ORF type:complete len:106 (-),score=8.71 TRINITY_DN4717_c0_g2_i4:1098-1415(-)
MCFDYASGILTLKITTQYKTTSEFQMIYFLLIFYFQLFLKSFQKLFTFCLLNLFQEHASQLQAWNSPSVFSLLFFDFFFFFFFFFFLRENYFTSKPVNAFVKASS